jgi:hypothetical protein
VTFLACPKASMYYHFKKKSTPKKSKKKKKSKNGKQTNYKPGYAEDDPSSSF